MEAQGTLAFSLPVKFRITKTAILQTLPSACQFFFHSLLRHVDLSSMSHLLHHLLKFIIFVMPLPSLFSILLSFFVLFCRYLKARLSAPFQPHPIIGAWGPGLLESDPDYDVAKAIEEDGHVELYKYSVGISQPGSRIARKRMNAGTFNRLFEQYKAAGPRYGKFGGKYFTVILMTLAMQIGVTITKEQIEYARSIYKSAGLFLEGIEQFGLALKEYRNEPYNFDSQGLFDTMERKEYDSYRFGFPC